MVQYILETLVFQLIFLLVYDLFLKKETFFQWNRAYLLTTFILSLVLPWIKIEALKTTVSPDTVFYPQFLFQLDGLQLTPETTSLSFWELLSWQEWMYIIGAVLMTAWFTLKLFKIQRLKVIGDTKYYPEFTMVVVKKSEIAFSFFKNVFLGDGIPKTKEPQIVAHELVHIKQWHSLDLLFFELVRIMLWFNPLVYVYQSRMAELHEFIADAHVSKTNKKEQYQLLLSETFQTQNLSFVNQFFKQSLIKKRIVMLTKEKSKTVFQLKYLLLVPVILGMLFYSSCERDLELENGKEISHESTLNDEMLIKEVQAEIDAIAGNKKYFEVSIKLNQKDSDDSNILSKRDYFKRELLFRDMFKRVNSDKVTKKTLNLLKKLPYPSNNSYKNYVNRKKVFQVLDKNLKASINQREKTIRTITKEDKNLGPGEWIAIKDVSDLTGDEIRKLNLALNSVEGTNKTVVISDGKQSFLITNVIKEPVIISIEDSNESKSSNNNQIAVPFAIVEEVPIFPGCENVVDKKACFQEKMMTHIRKHFNYPKEAQDLGVQGRVSLIFTIDTDGSITNIRKRGPHKLLENEAERIIKRLPKMQPGRSKGEVVKVPFSIPITFRLQETADTQIPFPKMATDAEGLTTELKDEIKKYNQLVEERNRLLENANRENPIIFNLEKQMTLMQLKIREHIDKLDVQNE